jgi:hypothetical protein
MSSSPSVNSRMTLEAPGFDEWSSWILLSSVPLSGIRGGIQLHKSGPGGIFRWERYKTQVNVYPLDFTD